MWQTMLNSVTFGRNIALGALGRATAVPAERPWQRRIDAADQRRAGDPGADRRRAAGAVGRALGRGGAISLRFELL